MRSSQIFFISAPFKINLLNFALQIQAEMGDLLDKAFNDVMAIPREQVTYEVLTRVVEDDRLLQNSTGWKQVCADSFNLHCLKFQYLVQMQQYLLV